MGHVMCLLQLKNRRLLSLSLCAIFGTNAALAQDTSGINSTGKQAYPYSTKYGWKTNSPPSLPKSSNGAEKSPLKQQGFGDFGNVKTWSTGAQSWNLGEEHSAVPQEKATYSLEDQGAWKRTANMRYNKTNPTQLAAGSYKAPPAPGGTVFANSGVLPNTRPKSVTAPTVPSDIYGMYPQNVIGTWLLNSGGQWGEMLEGSADKTGVQKYDWVAAKGAALLQISADGSWILNFAGKTQKGRWADAPDTVHLLNLDGEEQFAYWNHKGQLELQSKSGKVKRGTKKSAK